MADPGSGSALPPKPPPAAGGDLTLKVVLLVGGILTMGIGVCLLAWFNYKYSIIFADGSQAGQTARSTGLDFDAGKVSLFAGAISGIIGALGLRDAMSHRLVGWLLVLGGAVVTAGSIIAMVSVEEPTITVPGITSTTKASLAAGGPVTIAGALIVAAAGLLFVIRPQSQDRLRPSPVGGTPTPVPTGRIVAIAAALATMVAIGFLLGRSIGGDGEEVADPTTSSTPSETTTPTTPTTASTTPTTQSTTTSSTSRTTTTSTTLPNLSGQNPLRLGDQLDLDTGRVGATGADVVWFQPQSMPRRLTVKAGAVLKLASTAAEFDAVTKAQLAATALTEEVIEDSQVRVGAMIAVRTGDGRLAKLRVESRHATTHEITLRWVTFPA